MLSLTAWFIEPVVYLLGMGTGLGKYLRQIQNVEYIDFIAPGLLVLSAMYGSIFETSWNAFFRMERGRVYEACAATPLSYEDIALGEIVWASTRSAMYGSAFIAVALPFGVFHSWWGLAAFPGLLLVGAMFGVLSLTYTYLARKIDYLSYFWTLFITPMFMFSGVFFPLDRLPEWLQRLAWFMPMHHGVDFMRALITHGDARAAAGPLLWMVVVTLVVLPIPLVSLRRRLS